MPKVDYQVKEQNYSFSDKTLFFMFTFENLYAYKCFIKCPCISIFLATLK